MVANEHGLSYQLSATLTLFSEKAMRRNTPRTLHAYVCLMPRVFIVYCSVDTSTHAVPWPAVGVRIVARLHGAYDNFIDRLAAVQELAPR